RLALELSGDLFLRLDGSAVHHRIGDIDRDVQAYTQRDGIAGPGVDFNLAVLRLDDHPGKEDIVAQVVDDNALHRTAKLKDDGFQQVMGERASDGHTLKLNADCLRLKCADPDRQVPVGIDVFKHHHAVLRH